MGEKSAGGSGPRVPIHGREAAGLIHPGEQTRGRGRTCGQPVVAADLEVAFAIGVEFSDQDFSIVDRTSFAVMQRLGFFRAAAVDEQFASFRFGRRRDRVFEIVR